MSFFMAHKFVSVSTWLEEKETSYKEEEGDYILIKVFDDLESFLKAYSEKEKTFFAVGSITDNFMFTLKDLESCSVIQKKAVAFAFVHTSLRKIDFHDKTIDEILQTVDKFLFIVCLKILGQKNGYNKTISLKLEGEEKENFVKYVMR